MSVQKQIDRLLTRRAAECFEIYRTGQSHRYSEVVGWLAESPRHLAEFLEIARQYPLVRDVLRSQTFDLEAMLQRARRGVTPLHSPPVAPSDPTRRWDRSRRWFPAVTTTLLAATIALWVLNSSLRSRWQHYETQIGEQRVIQLLDGSVMTLDARSQVDVSLSGGTRNVRLLRGEALFKVAHDQTRPFWVRTQGAAVRAVGTQFNVYARQDGSTTVAVIEGRVEVSPAPTPVADGRSAKANPIPLAAGQGARVARTGVVQRNDHADLDSALAWRQRRLVFDRTPLEEIVAEFNRYNRNLTLKLGNLPPGEYHYTGSFDADDPKSLALLLSREPGLVVEQEANQILIRGREEPRAALPATKNPAR